MAHPQPLKVLTIAGSDSGGAAGLQADLKTFTALGVYGMSAVTAVTAQNSVRVAALQSMPAALVTAQIEAVLQDYGAAAVKTGFLGSALLVEAVAAALHPAERQALPLVIDPVLVNHRGEPMFGEVVTEAYRRLLLPGCTMVTPNRREAAMLCGQTVETWTQAV
ncbi:MAG TPA: hydroxymethylpyrimidine/phosphomethylpyrimidine kinase, partial [Candidatus Binatia bacterium]|nr:hydroxymethylpyrimidine/phosphomethylpyrimidine kinase [Candidatus Binatia bacterium]